MAVKNVLLATEKGLSDGGTPIFQFKYLELKKGLTITLKILIMICLN